MTIDPVEARFFEQYAHLDDATLREIAGGDVPSVRQGQYLYAARRVARAILLKRGAREIPSVPAWDPSGTVPWRFRLAVIVGLVLLSVAAAVAMRAFSGDLNPSDEAVCEATRESIATSDFAWHATLAMQACEVRHQEARRDGARPDGARRDGARRDGARRDGAVTRVPIAGRLCLVLTEPLLKRIIATKNAVTLGLVQRIAERPVPGRYCSKAPIIVADRVQREGRPWHVALRPGLIP